MSRQPPPNSAIQLQFPGKLAAGKFRWLAAGNYAKKKARSPEENAPLQTLGNN